MPSFISSISSSSNQKMATRLAESPSPSRATRDTERQQSSPKFSFAHRKTDSLSRKTSLEPVIESGAKMAIEIHKHQPRGKARLLSQKRSQTFEEAIYPDLVFNAWSDRIRCESIIVADIKTNVMITNEYTFMRELSFHLSARYNKPVDSIMVTVQHGACMLFSGSFEAAYTLTINAIPFHVQPATNKRNTALLQKHLGKALNTSPSRGVIRFVAVPEECFGWNGTTVASEIADADGQITTDEDESSSQLRKTFRSLSLRRPVSTGSTSTGQRPASRHRGDTIHEAVTSVTEDQSIVFPPDIQRSRTLSHKKSFVHGLFSRYSKGLGASSISGRGSPGSND